MSAPSPRPDRLLRGAVALALAGLASLLAFLLRGFAPWSVGVGLFLGAPLLGLAILLYLAAVVRDLRRRKIL